MRAFRGILLSATLSLLAAATQPVVKTSLGPVGGKILNGANAFLGIPFAADTGGVNRFRAPVAREPWTDTRQTVDWAPGCVQTGMTGNETGPGADVPANQSEDCLNFNVYSPANASEGSALPVMVFLHGGAFVEGWNVGPQFLYEASMFAKKENIVVFFPNYRLQSLGFLNLPDLGLMGNYGVQDQTFALEWVVKNAKAFGGDPKRITLAGQSAGAMSVGIHMVNPASKGLFQRAIMQSNVGGFKYKTAAEQHTLSSSFLKYAGCTKLSADATMQCLQKLTSDQVRTASDKAGSSVIQNLKTLEEQWGHFLDLVLAWTPTVGTVELPMQVQDAFAQGKATYMPLLEGTNKDEGLTFIGYGFGKFDNDFTGLEYRAIVDFMLPGETSKVVDALKGRYEAPGLFKNCAPQVGKIVTDMWFKCGSQRLALYNAKAGQETYNYRYIHPMSAAELKAYTPAIPPICVNITCHSTEIPSVLGSAHYAVKPSPLEQTITQSMMSYWGSFIRGGAPVNPGGVEWPAFGEDRAGILLGDEVKQESEPELCNFWDSIGYPRLTSAAEDHTVLVV